MRRVERKIGRVIKVVSAGRMSGLVVPQLEETFLSSTVAMGRAFSTSIGSVEWILPEALLGVLVRVEGEREWVLGWCWRGCCGKRRISDRGVGAPGMVGLGLAGVIKGSIVQGKCSLGKERESGKYDADVVASTRGACASMLQGKYPRFEGCERSDEWIPSNAATARD